MNGKKALLIAGGGTLGRYTAKELLKLGYAVDIICLEDCVSNDALLHYWKGNADLHYLEEFLEERHYDGIVNFIHYYDVETYRPIHMLLSEKTDHLIFLSSYRVYSDKELPITETSPLLLDVVQDKSFSENEFYAVPKTKNERFIQMESGTDNWTIVRPVISFSDRRLDIVTATGREVLTKTRQGEAVRLPRPAKNLTAGLDWAGNSGKLIAHLLQNEKTLREAYTVSTAPNLTWEEIAAIYTEEIGAKFEWVDTEEYLEENPYIKENPQILIYDRFLERKVDCSKVMEATGLAKYDFLSIREGLQIELEKIRKES